MSERKVYFNIKHHSDRTELIKILQDNGYDAGVYVSPYREYLVGVVVGEAEVEESDEQK